MVSTKAQVIQQAYERGLLTYKVRPYQRVIYDALWGAIKNPDGLKYYLNCARRFGKSHIMTLIAIEYALRNPLSQIRFAAPTGKMLRKITYPIMRTILKDCPENLMPEFNATDNVWRFKNGSEIHLSGTENGSYDNLRGTASNLNLIDECGFMSELDVIVKSILIPQTITTGGKTILASTPPDTPAHDAYAIAMDCQAEGRYHKLTVHDNKSLTPELIEQYAKESGGYESTTWRREYLCEWVVDEELQVLPEWLDDYIGEPVPDQRDPYHHRYTSMNLEVRDATAALFGHFDYKEQILYITDELTMKGNKVNTETLSTALLEKESEVFGNIKTYRRMCDPKHKLLLQDLGLLHGMYFILEEDDLVTLVNEARVMIKNGHLRISPKCVELLENMKYAVWTENRSKLGSSTRFNNFAHLKALLYMIRKIDQGSDPVPLHLNMVHFTHWIPTPQQTNVAALKKMFNLKR